MRATFQIEKPHVIDCSMTIIMPLEDWKELQDQLHSKWPSSELASVITSLILQAQKTFEEKGESLR